MGAATHLAAPATTHSDCAVVTGQMLVVPMCSTSATAASRLRPSCAGCPSRSGVLLALVGAVILTARRHPARLAAGAVMLGALITVARVQAFRFWALLLRTLDFVILD